jgi:hypothetical protein
MTRSLARILLASLALCAVVAAPAQANKTQALSFDAPHDLLNGTAARDSALSQLTSLGVHELRVVLYWHNVAPAADSKTRPAFDATNPASYNWGQYDSVIQDAQARGWPVLLTVSGPVPKWATRSHKSTVNYPSAKEFQAFMTAVARHYAGTTVKWYAVWNEPNHPKFLGPQYSRRRKHGKGHKPLSPGIYRQLFLAAFRGMRAAGVARPQLLMGETEPRGTSHDVAPLTFLRGALCLSARYQKSPKCSNLPAVGYAHHAYTTRLGPFFKPSGPNDVTIGVLGRLTRALNLAARAGAIRPHMPIYLTEFGIQSFPDHLLGVSPTQQYEYYAISERLAYYNPRVVQFSQYLLTDDKAQRSGVFGRFGGFESGLRYANGKIKPSYAAFRLPLVAVLRGSRVTLWGHVRPATGRTTATVFVADRGHKKFRRLRTVRTNTLGYFTFRSSWRKGRRWILRWRSPSGQTFSGRATRAYTPSGRLG